MPVKLLFVAVLTIVFLTVVWTFTEDRRDDIASRSIVSEAPAEVMTGESSRVPVDEPVGFRHYSGPGDTVPSLVPPGTLTGLVLLEEGFPARRWRVAASSGSRREVYTSNEGWYSFERTIPGPYEIAVSEDRAPDAVWTVVGRATVHSGEVTHFDVVLTPGRTIEGSLSMPKEELASLGGRPEDDLPISVTVLQGSKTVSRTIVPLSLRDEPQGGFYIRRLPAEIVTIRLSCGSVTINGKQVDLFVDREVDLTEKDGVFRETLHLDNLIAASVSR